MGKGICALILVGAFMLGACAGQNAQQDDGFDMSICNNIPVGIEAAEAMNPDSDAVQDKLRRSRKMYGYHGLGRAAGRALHGAVSGAGRSDLLPGGGRGLQAVS